VMHLLVLVSCAWTCALEHAISAIVCCIIVMSIELSLGVGEEADGSPIGGACMVLGRVCIARCTVHLGQSPKPTQLGIISEANNGPK
jgi:hypothetical protein